jgi:MFS family permease
MMFGYDAGVLAGVQATEPFLSAIGHPERYSTVIIPMIASSYTLGAWVMSMIISFIGAPMGRRNCILAGNLLVIVGGALQATTTTVAQIIVGRVLCVSAYEYSTEQSSLHRTRDLALVSSLAPCLPTWYVSALFRGSSVLR